MGLISDLYRTFNDSKFSEAKRLMSIGRYEECISNIYNNTSLFEPLAIMVEGRWYVSCCYEKLRKYNQALEEINFILSSPSNDNEIRKYKDLAKDLENKIRMQLRSTSNTEVKYPESSFLEFISHNKSLAAEPKICYEGMSKQKGEYYIRNTIQIPNITDGYSTLYLKPIADTTVEIFIYYDYIYSLLQMKDDDPISYHVIINKLNHLQKLINRGENGACNEVSVYKTTDYGRDIVNRYRVPVIGLKCYTSDASHCTIDDFEDEIDALIQQVGILLDELEGLDDSIKYKIGLLAFLKGSLGKIAGHELSTIWQAIHH